ncbi:protein phosphatase 1 inhibitor domain-containing protein [Phthorimaea operculella]|nr:protein phosphatase 1 inhibitor domain-containing protein [Phthorimaea operculella]
MKLQMRFKKRYQRKLKPNEPEVITLQDVKDLAIYMAPLAMLSPSLINVLHIPTTERFLRALILYCHYYLQIGQEMAERVKELQNKIRTPTSEAIEATYRQNLADLKNLVAKEYSVILCGIWDTKTFHHMGIKKKRKSLSDKDARFIETFILMCTQIVWLALGRRSFNQLELEINRLTKTDIYNSAEHRLKTGYYSSLSPLERGVLIGSDAQKSPKLIARSPLMSDIFCKQKKPVDFRLLGIGAIEFEYLPERLRYLLMAIAGPEEDLEAWDVTVGILGKPRRMFDTALYLLDASLAAGGKKSSSSTSSGSTAERSKKQVQSKSRVSQKSSEINTKDSTKLWGYSDLVLPEDEMDDIESFPLAFPAADAKVRYCSQEQRMRWITRLYRMLNLTFDRRVSEINEISQNKSRSSRIGV